MSNDIELDLRVGTCIALKKAGFGTDLVDLENAIEFGIQYLVEKRNFKFDYIVDILDRLFENGYPVIKYIDKYINTLSDSFVANSKEITFLETYKQKLYPVANEPNIVLQNSLVDNYLKKNGLLTAEQLGQDLFVKWINIVSELYVSACLLKESGWKTVEQLKKISQQTDFWNVICKIYNDFIGEINGVLIKKDTDIVNNMVVFVVLRCDLAKEMNLIDVENFRLNFEMFLAKNILRQRKKSDNKLSKVEAKINRRKKMEKRKENKIIETTENNDVKNNNIDANKFTYLDTVYVYKVNTNCHISKHSLKSATAVLLSDNDIPIELNVEHCSKCNKLYMSYTVYENYKKKYGILIGDLKMDGAVKSTYNDFVLSESSPLKLCGYSVSQKDDLSSFSRQNIISKIIDLGILSKGDVIHYLEYFIKMNGHKKNNEFARVKWEEDLKFTLKYRMSEQNKYRIKKIEKLQKKVSQQATK